MDQMTIDWIVNIYHGFKKSKHHKFTDRELALQVWELCRNRLIDSEEFTIFCKTHSYEDKEK